MNCFPIPLENQGEARRYAMWTAMQRAELAFAGIGAAVNQWCRLKSK